MFEFFYSFCSRNRMIRKYNYNKNLNKNIYYVNDNIQYCNNCWDFIDKCKCYKK